MARAREAALLARLGFRSPDRALADLPAGFENDGSWAAVLAALGVLADPDAGLRRLVGLGSAPVERVKADVPRARGMLGALAFSEDLSALIARTPGLTEELLGGPRASRDTLRALRDAGLVAIAATDLASAPNTASFVATGRALSDLADACLTRALEEVGAPGDLAVMAMGKYGGRELNYASDIDVLFVSATEVDDETERRARALLQLMSGPPPIFRMDADLRPQGRDGPLVRSLDAYRSYYARWAEVWEFQALIKCRFASGDASVGAAFLEIAEPHVWPDRLDPAGIEQIRALKARAEREVQRRGLSQRQVKLAPGGIRDVEFAVQLLQLVHGRHHPPLRLANTLDALRLLGAEGFVGETDAEELAEAYVFLRHAEHRLQLVHGRQTHTLPRRRAELEHLARGLAFRDTREASAVESFERAWRRTTATVRQIHERLFYRPLLEAFGAIPPLGPVLGADEGGERLLLLGFDRPPVVQEAIRSLTAGTSRRAKLMRAILPGLLSWLADTPDPTGGISRLRDLAHALDASPHVLGVLRDAPPVAELLCRALGTGLVLSELLQREPGLVAALGNPPRHGRETLIGEATSIVGRHRDPVAALAHLRRFKEGEWLSGAVRDLQAGTDPDVFVEVSRALSDLGDACVEAALMIARTQENVRTGGPPGGGFAVVAMGRYGGAELNNSSDLDVLFVYESDDPCPDGSEGRLYHFAVVERMMSLLASPPPIFRVDAELRPEGRNGPLVRSLDAYKHYYDRWAWTWEFQAMTRARHAAGDESVTRRLLDHVAPKVWPARLSAEQVHEIRRMKARIERERVKRGGHGGTQIKLGAGGLADVEFTAQLLQMRHGHERPVVRTPNTLDAVDVLRVEGLLGETDATWLRDAYLMLNRVRNHLFLLRGLPTDALPSRDEDLERLARSLGYGRLGRAPFLEDFRRVTRRARRVSDRLFDADA